MKGNFNFFLIVLNFSDAKKYIDRSTHARDTNMKGDKVLVC